jgi:hypothetical protein
VTLRIGGAKHAAAVEIVVGASVPEIVEVQRRRKHHRRVAGLYTSELMPIRAPETRYRIDVLTGVEAAQIRSRDPDAAAVRDQSERDISELAELDTIEETTSLLVLTILAALHTIRPLTPPDCFGTLTMVAAIAGVLDVATSGS